MNYNWLGLAVSTGSLVVAISYMAQDTYEFNVFVTFGLGVSIIGVLFNLLRVVQKELR